jgi:hypothetical protein
MAAKIGTVSMGARETFRLATTSLHWWLGLIRIRYGLDVMAGPQMLKEMIAASECLITAILVAIRAGMGSFGPEGLNMSF